MFVKVLISHIYFCEYEIPSSFITRQYLWKYFYCIITSYSLSIEQQFLYNQFLSSANDTNYSWYNKCGEENDGLKVIFHIKGGKVHIFNPSLTPLEPYTEIFYVDGYVTPLMCLLSMKEAKILHCKRKLYWLVGNYCIISFHFILLWVILYLYLHIYFVTVMCSNL